MCYFVGQGGQGTVLYQTPQGLVCNNTAGAAGINTLPEGYFINLPQTPTITIQPDQQGECVYTYHSNKIIGLDNLLDVSIERPKGTHANSSLPSL